MIAWVKSFALSITAVAWVAGVPVAVWLWTGSADWAGLALAVSGGIVFLAHFFHEFVFDL